MCCHLLSKNEHRPAWIEQVCQTLCSRLSSHIGEGCVCGALIALVAGQDDTALPCRNIERIADLLFLRYRNY